MAYNTEELIKNALKAIAKHKLFFQSDVAPMIGISRQTWYDHNLDKVDKIKEALIHNRIEVKSAMRSKWYNSENPTLQMGLYKLIGSEEEYHRLANTKIDVSVSEKAPFEGIDLSDAMDDVAKDSNEGKMPS